MNILFVIATLGGGGAERVLINLAGCLVERGHSVTIAVNKTIKAYSVHPKVSLLFANPENEQTRGFYITRFFKRFRNYIRYVPFIKRTIKLYRPDVIITFLHCNMLPILMYHGNIPIISSEHNAMDRKISALVYFQRFFLNRFFDKVTVLTPFDKGYASAKGLKNVIIMPNPLTWPVMGEDEYVETFCKRKNIIACGRVDAWHIKGFDILIRAFASIAREKDDWVLNIAGKGSEESIEYLKKIADENGIKEKIVFLGFQSDVDKLMRSHSIFVLSSRTEGFPLALTEAMSSGVASVCFERLGNSIVADTIDGILVENQNIEQLSLAIEKLIDDADLRFKIGYNSIRNISRFSADRIVDKWQALFDELI